MAIEGCTTHGTVAAYRAGCRCFACYEAKCAYQRAFERHGRPYTTDAFAAREHLLVLQAHGIGLKAAAQLSGLGPSCIRDVRTGKQRRIRKATEQAILAVCTDDRLDGQRVPKAEALAIVERLHEYGIGKGEIARIIGLDGELHVTTKRRKYVTVRTLRKLQVARLLLIRAGRVPGEVLS